MPPGMKVIWNPALAGQVVGEASLDVIIPGLVRREGSPRHPEQKCALSSSKCDVTELLERRTVVPPRAQYFELYSNREVSVLILLNGASNMAALA